MVAVKALGFLEVGQQQLGFVRRIMMLAKPVDDAPLVGKMPLAFANMALDHFKFGLGRRLGFSHVGAP